MRYLIIGNGVAGTTAAQAIRKQDPSGEIVIVTDEELPFYSRIRLPQYLAGEVEEQALILHKPAWYEQLGLSLITGTHLASVDASGHSAVTAKGDRLPYDRLLVATGSIPSRPPLRGMDKRGIFTLRSISDARAIRDYSRQAEDVIILGGGVLGIEIGNALRKLGRKVRIVEFFPRLLPRQMDIDGSLLFRQQLEKLGLSFMLDARADDILGSESVEGLHLMDGRIVEGRMLIISAGIVPTVSLLKDAGASITKGVIVNDRMETSLPDIFAAGDAAEHMGIVYGIWAAAEEQGRVAGTNMAGGEAAYSGTVPANYLSVAGIEVFAAGDIDPDCRLPACRQVNAEKGIYRKVVVKDGCVAGAILCGDLAGRREIMAAIAEKRKAAGLKGLCDELRLSWMPSPK